MFTQNQKNIFIEISGKIQGVGFRPEVYRLAINRQVGGYVQNRGAHVIICAFGPAGAIDAFCRDIRKIELPGCEISGFQIKAPEKAETTFEPSPSSLESRSERVFFIKGSPDSDVTELQNVDFTGDQDGASEAGFAFLTITDRAICNECATEIFDETNSPDQNHAANSNLKNKPGLNQIHTNLSRPQSPENHRRKGYLFNSCAHCGPRYSIVSNIPFDRAGTSMNDFSLCPDCAREYHDPDDRRFHAQTISCPVCGPELTLNTQDQTITGGAAFEELTRLIRQGEIAAIKGTGGFHLVCDARCDEAVAVLRQIKKRPEKPFAVLYPCIEDIERDFSLSKQERKALCSPERPVVLLSQSKKKSGLSSHVNRGLQKTGVFLPDSGLYLQILNSLKFPIVATSFNFSGEPLIASFEEINPKEKLAIAHHNRKIENRCDDSVISFAATNSKDSFYVPETIIPIRLGKGYAPSTLSLPRHLPGRVLALGGAQKNTIVLAHQTKALISPHLGDLDSQASEVLFDRACHHLIDCHQFTPQVVVCDANPAYFSSQWARAFAKKHNIERREVFHHHAHALSLMAEHNLDENDTLFTAVWDGAGLGPDGSIWGSEFLHTGYDRFERLFSFRPFYQAGGAEAARYPHKMAASVLFDLFGEDAFQQCSHVWQALEKKDPAQKNKDLPSKRELLFNAWQKKINTPQSSSMGRLFDAAASFLNICHFNTFEGEAPMRLEDCADMTFSDYTVLPVQNGLIEWATLFEALPRFKDPGCGAAFFINSLAHTLIACARDFGRLGLSGGVFQNSKLVTKSAGLAEKEKIDLILHRKVPCNDGGLSLGQAVALC